MSRRTAALGVLAAALLTALFSGRVDLWSSGVKSTAHGTLSNAQAAPGEAESLEAAFIRIGQQVGPAVVSISTEQIERVKQYFRVHPFFGQEPFDEFFRQFYGDVPEQELRRFGLGSGILIDERGSVLTNNHVVADAEKITVTLADGREFVGEVKGKDPRSDLAVIKIDAGGRKLPTVILGDSGILRSGQWVVALGNPLGLAGLGVQAQALGSSEPTLSVGIISALHRSLPRTSRYDRDYSDLIQTDATINPGNSGGPLVNLAGEVVGINVAIITGPGNAYGFAIPINRAKTVLEPLIAGRTIVYGWLGVQIQDVTDDVAEYYGLKEREGVLVYQVLPDGPAQRAGMKDGDIIKRYDGQAVHHSRELIDRVSGAKAGAKVAVEILREGQRQVLQVVIGERPTDLDQMAAGGAVEAWRGMKVASLRPELAEQFNLPPETTGVIVIEVAPESPAGASGLRPGDVINEINRVRIERLDDYRRAIAQIQENALVRTNRGYVVIKSGE